MSSRNDRNGNGKKQSAKRIATAKPSKAQLAARARFVRDAERDTGIKITQAEVDAVLAEVAALR